MPFKPGQSGNPAGKKPGTRRKSSPRFEQVLAEIRTELRNGGKGCKDGKAVDPRDLLIAVVSHSALDLTIRVQAAAIVIAYEHARKTARHISSAIELPAPASVEEATQNIGKLASLAAAKTIALDEMNDLIGAQKAFIEAKIGTDAEAQLVALKEALRRHPNLTFDLTILGGLPDLPGADVIMPPRTLAVPVDRARGPSGDDGNGSGS